MTRRGAGRVATRLMAMVGALPGYRVEHMRPLGCVPGFQWSMVAWRRFGDGPNVRVELYSSDTMSACVQRGIDRVEEDGRVFAKKIEAS